ncbi:hypothetical protein L227DRAFT_568860, partial [Lentinus tigrinus ALCF2SS1-6]
FHVVQAITRWDCDNGDRGSPLQLGMEVKVQIIFLFRDLQRCRSWDEWPVEKDKFLESLRRVIMSQTEEPAEGTADSEEIAASLRPAHPNAAVPSLPTVQTKAQSAGPIGASNIKQKSSRRRARANDRPRCEVQWDYVRSYFEDNWFIEDWIPAFTDIGLPSDQSRDGPWNTNNWVERAFRTFDGVFLEARENKRIDRLVMIILNDFLTFYRHWQPEDRQANRRILELNYRAYQIWETDLVIPNQDGTYNVYEPANDTKPTELWPNVSLNPVRCTCESFRQTGKACMHLKAAELYKFNGPVSKWLEVESKSERRSARSYKQSKKSRGLPRERKMWSDDHYWEQMDKIYKRLKDEEERQAILARAASLRQGIPALSSQQ